MVNNNFSIPPIDGKAVAKQMSNCESSAKFPMSAYQKSEVTVCPESKAATWFGGSGVTCKFDDTTVDAFVGGKCTSGHANGYLADLTITQNLFKPSDDISFASQLRVRNNNCGVNNLQCRCIPLTCSFSTKKSPLPIDGVYVYPAYVTQVSDFDSGESKTRLGSLIGLKKNITDNSSLYVEVGAESSAKRCSDVGCSVTAGYRYTF